MVELGESIFVTALCKCVTLVISSQVLPSQLPWLRLSVEAAPSVRSLAPSLVCLGQFLGRGDEGICLRLFW